MRTCTCLCKLRFGIEHIAVIEQKGPPLIVMNTMMKRFLVAFAVVASISVSSALPADLSICDEYFFGRTAHLPNDQIPFCVNGGYCKASWIRDTQAPCECLRGFEGPHCEFHSDEVPTSCHLGCRNGGECQLGASSWQHYYRTFEENGDTLAAPSTTSETVYGQSWHNPYDLQHCSCPEGFFGTLCELHGERCGSDRCHNGGTCVRTTGADGKVNDYCDCSTAQSADGTRFAGEFCEHASTSYCTELPDHNGHQFCTNGGTCKGESHLGCHCPDGFVGPICEFKDQGNETPEPCNLSCFNHGICRRGAKDVSVLKRYGLMESFDGDRNMQQAYTANFEHCVCPSGFVGLQCEYQLDMCPGGIHACLNGGDCTSAADNRGKVTYGCDCDEAETRLSRFAGEFCEMQSTKFCTVDGDKSKSGINLHAFCTNDGECKGLAKESEEHKGCQCPFGYTGENCQFLTGGRLNGFAVATAGLFALITLGAIGALLLIKRHRKRQKYIIRKHMGAPPTIDLIAQSLGTDVRMAEYQVAAVAPVGKQRSSFIAGRHQLQRPLRKPAWAQRVAIRDSEDMVDLPRRAYYREVNKTENLGMLSDVELEETSDHRRPTERKDYWPNDVENDASNPIQIFDDISVSGDSDIIVSDTELPRKFRGKRIV